MLIVDMLPYLKFIYCFVTWILLSERHTLRCSGKEMHTNVMKLFASIDSRLAHDTLAVYAKNLFLVFFFL